MKYLRVGSKDRTSKAGVTFRPWALAGRADWYAAGRQLILNPHFRSCSKSYCPHTKRVRILFDELKARYEEVDLDEVGKPGNGSLCLERSLDEAGCILGRYESKGSMDPSDDLRSQAGCLFFPPLFGICHGSIADTALLEPHGVRRKLENGDLNSVSRL